MTPVIRIGYPFNQHRDWLEGSRVAMNWLLRHGANTPQFYRKFPHSGVEGLASKVYPNATSQGHDWACKFVLWFIVLDVQIKETAVGMAQQTAVPVFVEIVLVFLWTFPEEDSMYESLMHCVDAFPSSELRDKCQYSINSMLSRRYRNKYRDERGW